MTEDFTPTGILAVVRGSPIGRRRKISRQEMADLLHMLQEQKLVELGNGWSGSDPNAPAERNAWAWTHACSGITVISILPEEKLAMEAIRFDQPGSMHPQQYATLSFVSDESLLPGSLDYLRRHAARLLIVREEEEDR